MRYAIATIAVVLGAALAGQAQAGGGLEVLGFGAKPKYVDVSGTGSWILTKLHWTSWGGATARAEGQFGTNLCKPDCAAGHFQFEPARVVARHVATCNGRRAYTVIVVLDLRGRRIFDSDLRGLTGC